MDDTAPLAIGPQPVVLYEIQDERARQDEKWGEHNHPDGTGPRYEDHANFYRERCNRHAVNGTVTWADILLEEVFEALAEADPVELRAELVQAAAVATAWVEAIDRRTA